MNPWIMLQRLGCFGRCTIVTFLVLLQASCGQEGEKKKPALSTNNEAPRPAEKRTPSLLPDLFAPPDPKARKTVDLSQEQDDEVSLLAEELLDFLESKFAKDTLFFSRYKENFERRIRDSKHFISLLREVYVSRKFTPMFFSYENKVPTLTASGMALRDLIVVIESHGLEAKDYRVKNLRSALAGLDGLANEYAKARKSLPDGRAQTLWGMMEDLSSIPDEARLKSDLVSQGFSNADRRFIREFAKFYPNMLQAKRDLNQAVQEIDILLLRGFFKFLLDFKYVLRAHPFKVTPEISLAHVKFREQLREDFRKAAPDFADYLLELVPRNPGYARLQQGLSHYRRLRDEGKIDKIRIKKNLKRGRKGTAVRGLTKRLILEGYLDPQHESDVFGKLTEVAVKKYQRKHQLRESGRIDSNTRSSMNVSMAKRTRQIELGLQRWRESPSARDNPDFYFLVNIPAFELTVWENNTLARTHRVVVGNTKEETSIERRQRGRFNHTPLLAKKVSTVVLNPLWFPPPRLQKELLADVVKEPDYFEKHNYGIRMNDDGSEVIFQKAGANNALGLVKFLFPNEYHVYLHDTPKKALFDRPVRAYSHGCMRLDKPLAMARYVLKKINGMTDKNIDKILEKEKEHYVKLDAPIPIYVEYNVVGTDSDGWVYFYADIYKYDKAYWESRLPVELAEDLTPEEIKRLSRKGGAEIPAGLDEDEDTDDGVVPGA